MKLVQRSESAASKHARAKGHARQVVARGSTKMMTDADEVRKRLRLLRHLVDQANVLQTPTQVLQELVATTAALARQVRDCRVPRILLEPLRLQTGIEDATALSLVDLAIQRNPDVANTIVVHPGGVDEETLYRQDLGFSEQEYKDLLAWKKAWNTNVNVEAAFRAFCDQVIADLQAEKYAIKLDEVIAGVGGVLGIALDTGFFLAAISVTTPAFGAAVPALAGSCSTGIAVIAMKFDVIRKKLFGRGK